MLKRYYRRRNLDNYDGMGTGMYVGQYDLVADGYFVYLNIYDMQVYTVGKGASKLTVDAPAAAITQGQSLVIRGTITDIAAGTTQERTSSTLPQRRTMRF